MTDAIRIENLTKQFMGLKAIDDLCVAIPAGVATGLIGPNGSGKTTLMNVLTGILRPEAGAIYMGEQRYHRIHPQKLRQFKIARTFQDGRLVNQLSVEDNLLLTVADNDCWRSFWEHDMSAYAEKLEGVLQTVHLSEHRHKNAGDLSYGQGKLLEIGRTLMQNADIYFFDEPFTGLFPEVVEQVLDILQSLKAKGKTLVVIEHNMSLIERLCDHIIVLDSGHLLAEGKPCEVLQNEEVRAAYLGK